MKSKIYLLILLLSGFAQSISAQQLSLQWAQSLGGTGWDYVNSMLTDSSGNYILGGSLKGTLPGDSTHPKLAYSNNAFLASCDTNGNILWQKTFGGTMFDNISSMVKTSQGILISGIFQDTLCFEDEFTTTLAYSGAYLALINEQGIPLWLRNIGGQAIVKQIHICSNPQGGTLLAGVFADSLQLAGQEMAVNGEKGIFITKILTDGSETNSRVFKGTGSLSLGGILCNDSLICLAGSFSDTLHISDTTLVSFGEEDVFIALFTPTGELRRLFTAGGIGAEQVRAVTLSPAGDFGIVGSFNYSLLMQNHILQTNGGKDIFIAVFDPSGILKWIKNVGGLGNDYGYSISTDHKNNYFVSGNFVHYISMPDENGNLVELDASSAFGNAFIAKFNALGELKASYNLPATSEDYCQSLIADSTGLIIATGNFFETMQLQGVGNNVSELVTKGERDIFIIRFFDICNDVTVDAGIDTALCPGQSIYLTSPEPYPYFRWLPAGLPNQGIDVTQPGTYKLLITNENGCIASDSLVVIMRQLPSVIAGNDTTLAAGENLQLDQASVLNTETIEWNTQGTGYFNTPGQLLTWYSPSFTDVSVGSVLLELASTNQCGTTTDSLLLTIQQDDDGITVFPNPTQGIVNLVCTEGTSIQTASITTQAGTVIDANITINNAVMQYDLSAFPPGTFLFHLITGTNTVTKIINKL